MQERWKVFFLLGIFVLLPFVSASFFGNLFGKISGDMIKQIDLRYDYNDFPVDTKEPIRTDIILKKPINTNSDNLLANDEKCTSNSQCLSGLCGDTFFNGGDITNLSTNPEMICHSSADKCIISSTGSEVIYGYHHCYAGDAYRVCYARDGKVGNSWGAYVTCSNGEACEEGLGCIKAESCTEGEYQCTAKNALEKCVGGIWQHQVDCGLDYGLKCSGNSCIDYPTINCEDTDNGDIYRKGSVYLDGVLSVTDFCFARGSDYLRENDCYADQSVTNRLGINYRKIKCEHGCWDGACISLPDHTCSKEGGNDIYSKGHTIVDSNQTFYDTCYTKDYLLETYCDENNLNDNEKVFCYAGCENGACKKIESKCFDSDASNTYEKGEIQLENGSIFVDSCYSDLGVTEYSCSGDNLVSKNISCAKGCDYGACLTDSCVDYDGGNNYTISSTVRYFSSTDGFISRGDYCSDSKTLVEATCSSGSYFGKYFTCPNYCSNGACVDSLVDFSLSSQIYTEKEVYSPGEQIDLTGSITTINSNSVKSLDAANKFVTSAENNTAIETSEGMVSVDADNLRKRYVVEFEDEPVLDKFASLSKKAEKNENRFIANVPILKNLILTNDNLDSRVDQYSYELEKNSNKLENKIEKIKDKKTFSINGNVVLNNEKSNSPSKYKYSFYGVTADLTDGELKKVRNLDGVKSVYLDKKSEATSEGTTDLLDVSSVWKSDVYGNNCGVSGGDCLDGSGIKIAIIDSGVDYTHSDLGGCFGSGCKVSYGYDYVNKDSDPMDDNGHGTHCASIAAGKGRFDGIAPGATIYAYKVLDQYGSGWNSDILLAIENSLDPNGDSDFSDGADVLSLSLGSEGNPNDFLSQAVDRVSNLGIPVIVAAGNDGPSSMTISSPGVAENAITVGSVDHNKKIAEYSSRGPVVWDDKLGNVHVISKPDIVAYGTDICAAKATKNNGDGVPCGEGNYISLSGTSMATPEVAGLVALIRQKNKDLSPLEIKSLLKDYAEDLGVDNGLQGAGLISPKKIFFDDSSQFILDKYYLDLGEISVGEDGQISFSIKNQLKFDLDLSVEVHLNDSNADLVLDSNSFTLGPYQKKEISGVLSLGNSDSKPYELKTGYILVDSAMYEKKINFVYSVSNKNLVGDSFLRGEGIEFFSDANTPPLFDFFDYDLDGDLDALTCFHSSCFIYYNEGDHYSEKFFYAVPPIATSASGWSEYSLTDITHGDLNGDGKMDVSFSGVSGRAFVLYGGEEKEKSVDYSLSNNQEISFDGIKLKLIRSYSSDYNAGQAVFSIDDPEFPDTRKEWFNSISSGYSNSFYYKNYAFYIDSVSSSGVVKFHVVKSSVDYDYLGDFGESLNSKLVDYDEDGDLDIVFVKGKELDGKIYALDNNNGVFGDEKVIFQGYNTPYLDFDFVDYDGDGDLDLVYDYSFYSDKVYLRVFENKGQGIVKENNKILYNFDTSYVSYSVDPFVLEDFDLDGDLDIAIGFGDGHISYLENDGNSYLPEKILFYYPTEVRGLKSLDFNSDGKKDLIISTFYSAYYKENYLDKDVIFREVSKLKNEANSQSVFDLKMTLQKKSSASWLDQMLVVDKKGVVLDSGKSISLSNDNNYGWNGVDVSTTSKGEYRVYLEAKNSEGKEYFDSYEFSVQ